VNAGDVIATVGNSGGQKHAGLYFELRHRGEPTDPLPWIKTT
jgi:septal ring factor EnvC (AmiA/AmiB activator)